MEYSWPPKKYIEVHENAHPALKEYMDAEIEYLTHNIQHPEQKTFIDVGAGYGRVIPTLANIGKRVIAVEIDKKELGELRRRASQYSNVTVIEGDAQNLSELLEGLELENPVVLSMQNTLGTPTGGSDKILAEMVRVAQENSGEILISLFIQEGLKDYGIPLYQRASVLTGEPDLNQTDFEKGTFVSKTGYKSHWWRSEERAKLAEIVDGTKIAEVTKSHFYLLHSKY